MTDKIMLENEKTFISEQGLINLPTGQMTISALRQILNSLPFEITFADANDHLVYYSENDQRIEKHQQAELGLPLVSLFAQEDQLAIQNMLTKLHQGEASHFEQWYPKQELTIYNNFYAIRDIDGTYLGTLQFTGDITRIQGFRGVKTVFNAGKVDS